MTARERHGAATVALLRWPARDDRNRWRARADAARGDMLLIPTLPASLAAPRTPWALPQHPAVHSRSNLQHEAKGKEREVQRAYCHSRNQYAGVGCVRILFMVVSVIGFTCRV